MTIRKRKQVSPDFQLPPPYQPMTGEEAKLLVEGIYPHCALMQIVEADTECNYVTCRGYDPRNGEYFTETPGFPVAKPYGKRFKGVYRVGQVFPAFLPLPAGFKDGDKTVPRIGQNPGKVTNDCQGNPLDLDEELLLLEAGGVYVNWMLIDGGPARVYFELNAELPQFTKATVKATQKIWDPTADSGKGGYTCGEIIDVGDLNNVGHTADVGGQGTGIMHEKEEDPYWVCVIDDLCCPGEEQPECQS